uniref:C2H2-type domain-containing protein n=1 Tax=Rhabditophanes sp. KR3021 TaxID=114890 RepID=A0AC35U6Z7_9BILA
MENYKDIFKNFIKSLKSRQQSTDYGDSITPSSFTSSQKSTDASSLVKNQKFAAAISPLESVIIPVEESSPDAMETGIESPFLKNRAHFRKFPSKQFTFKRSSANRDGSDLEIIGKIEKDLSERIMSEQSSWREIQVANKVTGETEKTFQCLANGKCSKYFDNKKSLARHQLTHLTDQFYCMRCHQLFNRCSNCRRHQLRCNGTKTSADKFDMVKYHLHNKRKMVVDSSN